MKTKQTALALGLSLLSVAEVKADTQWQEYDTQSHLPDIKQAQKQSAPALLPAPLAKKRVGLYGNHPVEQWEQNLHLAQQKEELALPHSTPSVPTAIVAQSGRTRSKALYVGQELLKHPRPAVYHGNEQTEHARKGVYQGQQQGKPPRKGRYEMARSGRDKNHQIALGLALAKKTHDFASEKNRTVLKAHAQADLVLAQTDTVAHALRLKAEVAHNKRAKVQHAVAQHYVHSDVSVAYAPQIAFGKATVTPSLGIGHERTQIGSRSNRRSQKRTYAQLGASVQQPINNHLSWYADVAVKQDLKVQTFNAKDKKGRAYQLEVGLHNSPVKVGAYYLQRHNKHDKSKEVGVKIQFELF